MPRIIFVEELDSTNNYLRRLLQTTPDLPSGTVVTTRRQTAGRGQRGNTWESAPEKNITLSVLLRPEGVDAASQFVVAEAVSLAVRDLVEALLPDRHEEVTVKWPNDIYVGDRKISGTLIENALEGNRLEWAIAGIGVNINQRAFVSDAPNPVSVWQLRGSDLPLTVLEDDLARRVAERTAQLAYPAAREAVHSEYKRRLWRREGWHRYRRADDGTLFEAEVADVLPTGHFVLRHRDGSTTTHAFKEIHQLL